MGYVIVAIVMAVLTFGGDAGWQNFVAFAFAILLVGGIIVWMDNKETKRVSRELDKIDEEEKKKKQLEEQKQQELKFRANEKQRELKVTQEENATQHAGAKSIGKCTTEVGAINTTGRHASAYKYESCLPTIGFNAIGDIHGKEKQEQREPKVTQEEKHKAWAQKMAEARLQKKIQKEKEEAEYIENKRNYCRQLESKLNSIGVTFVVTKEFCYDMFASENIEFDRILSVLKELNQKQICRARNQRFYIQYNFFITDLNNAKLIEITNFGENYSSMTFHQEDRDDLEFNKGNATKQAEDFLFCYLGNRKIKRLENSLLSILENGVTQVDKLSIIGTTTEERVCSALESSDYDIEFQKSIDCLQDNDMLLVDYELPNMSNVSDVKEYKYIASKKEISIKKHTDSYLSKRYEDVLYSIALRSLYEIFSIHTSNEINGVTFNGFVTQVNPATGITERKCILSIQVDKNKFLQINLSQVEPKACFKALKGVSASKLVDFSPITPILTFNMNDKRFVEAKDISVNKGTNLAAMNWEDFEHFVRELFEMEFARNGGEVRVTQASRDGGVDAVVFDPDPLRGGKIVIQAKRYTNTVGVSAVRDLYGTVINEGANSGILITTSDYGHDSYEFAKDKPLKLLNGGHLLALLHKNGRNAHINIEEAKKILTNNE